MTALNSKSVAWCVLCGHEVESTEGLTGCPNCGTKSVPCATSDDVTVRINWHELRILGIWAENDARRHGPTAENSLRVVAAIAQRIRAQHPNSPPLTMGGELEALRGAGYDAELRDNAGTKLKEGGL